MINIGIMQGRLSPPAHKKIQSFPKYSWEEEFYKARDCGLKSIEWIFEADDHEINPISSNSGINKIIKLVEATDVKIESICADYFMDIPYLKSDESTREHLRNKLEWLICQAQKINIKYIDLPFVDNSSIGGGKKFDLVYEFLEPVLIAAEKYNIIIALETDLKPYDFKLLLQCFNHPNLRANYDTGNSSGLGYNCQEELKAYGKWISTIHIKDRLLNGGTEPLGKGSADFDMFFSELVKYNFEGPIILQAAREPDEVKIAIKNKKFVEEYLIKYNIIQ